MQKIKPGMRIFIGTGVSEPLTLVRYLKESDAGNLLDLELFQLVSLGEAIEINARHSNKYRLKTFFSGWEAREAVSDGFADFIPSRYYQIPAVFKSGQIPIDVAFIQITPPNEAGYCCLGVCADVALPAIEQASLVVGEINTQIPWTFGETFVPFSKFDMIVESTQPPIYFDRWKVDETYNRLGANAASLIDDGSCIGFSVGPLYESLGRHLKSKRDLSIHTPFFFDNLMDLVNSGAVTNRHNRVSPGKSLTSYAIGTRKLMHWLDKNPLVEFRSIDQVFNPIHISRSPKVVAVLPAREIDLSGRITLHTGKGNVGSGPSEVVDFFNGALISEGGQAIFALTSRNREGKSNILISVRNQPNQFSLWESVTTVVTEYGSVNMKGRSVRERAQALIDITHPDDRSELVAEAKKRKILYNDQIFLTESVHLYPADIQFRKTFKDATQICFRALKPSDEENMRQFFYRLSNKSVEYRFFYPIKTMFHSDIQEYVNIDYRYSLSLVGCVDHPDYDRIIAEARFDRLSLKTPYAELSFMVDEQYQNMGIGTCLCETLTQLAKERQLKGFTADLLIKNKKMRHVFEKMGWNIKSKRSGRIERLTMDFYSV
ncbi:GNAT family N-acetyltransferase [Desulfosarcina variabilis]|uniref:GNAT family N-acetyltransferase n=1 Tax=Desulfosarcina variabilis TaxID=2300 RepID=UPI003AFA318F